MASSTEFITYQIEVDTKKGEINIQGVTEGFEDANKAFNKFKSNVAKGLPEFNNQLKNTSNASGAATSATLELGRTISDMPYGIRGVANNLSQFASQFSFMANKVDEATGKTKGFTGAVVQLAKGIKANFALLAITAAIAALDHFSTAQSRAKKETGDFSSLIDEQASKLIILNQIMLSSTISLDDKKRVIKDVNDEYDELNISIDNNGRLTKASQEAVDRLTDSLIKNAKAQAVLKKITQEQSKILEIEIERSKRITEGGVGAFEGTLEDLEKQRQKYIDRTEKQIDKSNLSEVQKKKALDNYMKSSTMQRFDALRDFRKKDLEDAEENISKMMKLVLNEELYRDFFGKSSSKGKIKVLQTPKEFKLDALNLQSEIDAWDKKMLMAATKDKDQRLQLELIFYKKKKELRRLDSINEVNQKLSDYKVSLDALVKSGKMEGSEAKKAKEVATKEAKEKVDGINKEYDKLISKAEEATKAMRLGLSGGDPEKEESDFEKWKVRFEKRKFYLETFKEFLSGVTNFINGEYDRQITIEQNKTNAINNELNQRLLNENLSKDERRRIQLQIGANDEALRKKQEQIEKKRFKLNKAANMSQALISTYLSATLAYASQMSLATPDAPVRAKIAYGAAVASGLLSVAAIARQKFQSSAGSGGQIGGGFGGGSGGNGREFNFNLVGNSQQNQLLDAIQGQFNQPIQAYVVNRDITNAQQLNEDIITNASF